MTQTVHFARRLNNADAKFFFMGQRRECNVAMMMLAVLAGEPSLDDLLRTLAPYEEEIPRFTDHLRPAPLNLAPPVWMPVGEFRIEDYVRELRLPPGAGWADVLGAVDRIQSAPFPKGKAPWEMVLFSGAPEGRSALAMKVHHSLSDGMALTLLFAKAFGGKALAEANAQIEVASEPPPRASPARLALADRRQAGRRFLARAAQTLTPGGGAARARSEREALGRALRPPQRWPLRSHRPARRLSAFRVEASAWREAAESRGGGSNDLYLALVARIMRRAFGSLDFDADPLRVAMPVSTRGEQGVQDARNTTALGVVELAGRSADLADLSEVRRRATAAKQAAVAHAPTLLEEGLELLPGRLRAAIDFRQFASCDVVATNVPIPIEGSLDGVPIEMMLMVAPAIGAAVSFSLTAYGDHLHLAGNADLGIAPNPIDGCVAEALAEVFGEGVESLGALGSRSVQALGQS